MSTHYIIPVCGTCNCKNAFEIIDPALCESNDCPSRNLPWSELYGVRHLFFEPSTTTTWRSGSSGYSIDTLSSFTREWLYPVQVIQLLLRDLLESPSVSRMINQHGIYVQEFFSLRAVGQKWKISKRGPHTAGKDTRSP